MPHVAIAITGQDQQDNTYGNHHEHREQHNDAAPLRVPSLLGRRDARRVRTYAPAPTPWHPGR
jgi:hypothetical protein